jgi:hypothetical protein
VRVVFAMCLPDVASSAFITYAVAVVVLRTWRLPLLLCYASWLFGPGWLVEALSGWFWWACYMNPFLRS